MIENLFRYHGKRLVVTGASFGMGDAQTCPRTFLNSVGSSYIGWKNLYTDGEVWRGVLNGAIDATAMMPDEYQ